MIKLFSHSFYTSTGKYREQSAILPRSVNLAVLRIAMVVRIPVLRNRILTIFMTSGNQASNCIGVSISEKEFGFLLAWYHQRKTFMTFLSESSLAWRRIMATCKNFGSTQQFSSQKPFQHSNFHHKSLFNKNSTIIFTVCMSKVRAIQGYYDGGHLW